MLDYPALSALCEVLRRGSFEAAAAALNVTPSAISQRIKALEERMGAVLVDRGPPVSGTETGHRLAAHLDQVRLLESTLPDQNLTPPVLRIAVNADSLASWVMPALAAAPGFVDLVVDDQDHALDLLRSGQVIAAITSDGRPVPGCDSFALGQMRYRATAHIDFARKYFKDGLNATTLSRAPSLCFNAKDTLQSRWAQMVTGRRIILPMHRIPSSQGFVTATRLGLGWAMNPEIMIRDDLAERRLMDLKPALPLDVPLFWQVSRLTARAIAPLTDAIRKTAGTALLP